MELGLLRELFKGGVLKKALIAPNKKHKNCWAMEIERNTGEMEHITLSMNGKTGEEKTYRRLTAAIMDAGRIGFEEIYIRLPKGIGSAPSVGAAGLK